MAVLAVVLQLLDPSLVSSLNLFASRVARISWGSLGKLAGLLLACCWSAEACQQNKPRSKVLITLTVILPLARSRNATAHLLPKNGAVQADGRACLRQLADSTAHTCSGLFWALAFEVRCAPQHIWRSLPGGMHADTVVGFFAQTDSS